MPLEAFIAMLADDPEYDQAATELAQLQAALPIAQRAALWIKDTDECLFCAYPHPEDADSGHDEFFPFHNMPPELFASLSADQETT